VIPPTTPASFSSTRTFTVSFVRESERRTGFLIGFCMPAKYHVTRSDDSTSLLDVGRFLRHRVV
jgi:hypothetical protein